MTFSFLFLLIDLLDEPHIPCFQGLGWCGGCQRNLLSLDAWQPSFLGIHGCVLSRGHSSVLGSCLPASPARELLPRRGGAVRCGLGTALLCPSASVIMRPLLSGSEGGDGHLLAPVASSTYYSLLRTPVSEHITITGVIQYHFGRCSQVYLLWAGNQREWSISSCSPLENASFPLGCKKLLICYGRNFLPRNTFLGTRFSIYGGPTMCRALCLGFQCPGMGLSLEIAYGQWERGTEKEAVQLSALEMFHFDILGRLQLVWGPAEQFLLGMWQKDYFSALLVVLLVKRPMELLKFPRKPFVPRLLF